MTHPFAYVQKSNLNVAPAVTNAGAANEASLDWGQFAKNTQHVLACIQAMAKYYQLMPANAHVRSLGEAGSLVEQTLGRAQQVSDSELLRVTAVLLNPYGLDLGSLSLALAHRHYARDLSFSAQIDKVRLSYRLPALPDPQGLSQAKAAMRPWLESWEISTLARRHACSAIQKIDAAHSCRPVVGPSSPRAAINPLPACATSQALESRR